MEFGNGGKEMAKDVLVGDNTVVFCQSFVDESFWNMLVDKPLHMVIRQFKDVLRLVVV
jgi:hypothetical protein